LDPAPRRGREIQASRPPARAGVPLLDTLEPGQLPGRRGGAAAASAQPEARLQLGRSGSAALRAAPLLLEWRDLGCSYRARGGGWAPVLRGVYGYAAPGSLTAVMGPSGSGALGATPWLMAARGGSRRCAGCAAWAALGCTAASSAPACDLPA
jgi:hypothetical protein